MATADYRWMKVALVGGKGVLPGIPGGTYRARVHSGHPVELEDYGLPAEAEVTVEAGKEAPLDVLVRTGGRLKVVVMNAKGAIVPAERLELADLDGKEVSSHFGNKTEDGMTFPPRAAEPAYGDGPVPPGRYVLRVVRYVENEKTIAAEKDVAILPGKTVDVEIRLPE